MFLSAELFCLDFLFLKISPPGPISESKELGPGIAKLALSICLEMEMVEYVLKNIS